MGKRTLQFDEIGYWSEVKLSMTELTTPSPITRFFAQTSCIQFMSTLLPVRDTIFLKTAGS